MQKKRKVWNTVLICLLTAVLAAGSGALSAKENTEEAEQEQQDQSASDEEQKTEMSSTAEIEHSVMLTIGIIAHITHAVFI